MNGSKIDDQNLKLRFHLKICRLVQFDPKRTSSVNFFNRPFLISRLSTILFRAVHFLRPPNSSQFERFNPYWQISGKFLRPFYWKTYPDQMLHIIYGFSPKIPMGEFSNKTVCVTPQNSSIVDWIMNFKNSFAYLYIFRR